MNSLLLEDHHENINMSQASGDLFQESFQSTCNDRPLDRIRLSQEYFSDSSAEVPFVALRKPRKAMTLSYSNLNFHSEKNSSSFKSSINSSSSKYFCPISPNNSAVQSDSSRLRGTSVNHLKPVSLNVHNLTEENVNVISLISESTPSDSSSILDDSSNHVSDYDYSKTCFKIPGHSSVKKRIIHEWLNNVSLSTTDKPQGRVEGLENTFIPQQVNAVDNKCKEQYIGRKSPLFNTSTARNSHMTVQSEVNINDESLFQAHEKCSIENLSKINEACNNDENSRVKEDVSGPCINTPNNDSNVQVDLDELLRESMERSCDGEFSVDLKRSISKIGKLSLNLSPIACSKSDEINYSSSVESESDDNHIETNEVVDSEDDSFNNIKFTRRKKHCFHISSDDSEAKDTANESEDRTNHNFEPYTPRRRLYFRNPLNNSLDDDAEPITCDDDTHKKISTSVSRKTVWKNLDNSKSIIEQICSRVLNTTEKNTLLSSVENEDSFSKTHTNSLQDLQDKINDCPIPRAKIDEPSTPISNKSYISGIDVSSTELYAHLDQSSPYAHSKRKFQGDSSTHDEHNVNQSNINITQVNFSDLPDVTCNDLSRNISYSDNQIEQATDPSSVISNKSCVSDIDVSSTELHAHLDQSSSFGHSRSKSQEDKLNFSTHEELNINQSNINITQVNFSDLPDVTCNDLSGNISYSNSQIEKDTDPSSIISKSFNDDEDPNQPSSMLPNEVDESPEPISWIKKHSKRNKLNFSTDDEISDKISENESLPKNKVDDSLILLSPKTKTFKRVSDEEDKFIYRVRSDDDSSSESECGRVVSKDSFEGVISIHTTSSDEEGDDDYAPWCDLETYLKKNIPATSKSFESSFSKNVDKRITRLASICLPGHSSSPQHTSFLLSLTPQVPDEMCHPQAVKYRESFSKFKNELIDLLFKLYNKEIFDDKLPPIEIKWSGHLTTTSGITKSSSKITRRGKVRSSSIKLSKTVVDNAEKMRDVLLHELCHAANWLIDEQAGGHGPLFKKWVNKIWMKYPEIPRVKTTHHYELKWKYLYKCTYCGYELGKMKLSLNENSCRLCGGLVTVNS